MKITLNLSPAPAARDRYALAWAVPAALIGLAAAVLLYQATMREFGDYQGMQKQVVDVQARADELHDREIAIRKKLDDPAYQTLLKQVLFVNNLIAERQLSLTALTTRLAGLLPQDAHLTGLALVSPKKPGDDYSIRMGITSKGEDAVETFLNDLEDAPDFKDVSIINQGFQEQSSQGQEVNLVCTARYLPDVDPDKPLPTDAASHRKPKKERGKPRAKEPSPNRQPPH